MSIVSELIRDMSLWKPQKEGLEVFHLIVQAVPFGKGVPKATTIGALAGLPAIQNQIKEKRFDLNAELTGNGGTEFPSFCFAIATGGGKTRLMGACIAYLYYTKGFKNFFILSKGETIYNKHRLEDFHPSSPKYVFRGLAWFPVPRLIDGDNYERSGYPELFSNDLTLYLFNIEKIFNERTDVEFRFHRFHENIGGSFADVLRSKPDLVFLMDESHNIRAEKSLKAINALKPILGLEFTATPKAANVIYAFSLRQATNEGGPNGGGLVKHARVITRRDDDSLIEEREDIKLRDGIRIHERKKTLLITYCKNNGLPIVKPRVLICAPPSQKDQEQKHIERIAEYVQSDTFLGGVYKGKVLAVHQGSDDEQIQQLLDLEKTDNDIEIVIHVNKLKEGWDVKTIYTIIPLRASVSDILTVQTIGRGLRLPFGRQVSHDPGLSEEDRKELLDIDTLEIISHEKYSAVLAKIKADPEWDVSVASEPGEEKESIQIDPDGEKGTQLNIPIIVGKIYSEEEIDLTDVKVSYESFEDVDIKLVGTDLANLEERDYERILEECNGSLVNFFVRILIEETDEFDIRDKEKLQRFVQAYIDKAQVAAGEKQVVLFKHRGKIAQDILSQIREKIRDKTTIDYVVTDRPVEFRSYWRNFPKGYVEKEKDAVVEEELTHNIIGGYTRTIFSRNVFESKQEKWLADILDRDKEVLRWVRPPTGQMPIAYKGGNYNPDFIVESKSHRFFVLEVKARDEITHEDVQTKARAAQAWCMAMSKATGKPWEYKLIPHDTIKSTGSFKGVISNAVAIPASP
ncbi:MAG: DEAD/DEAH box helicase family protein [candidate division Zixibacteria bacterium]|nr:DEAD/DEAH box helicase family protein [candidate division Zixibacteria bacterium]